MPLKIIVVSDASDYVGKVSSGSSTRDIDGKAVARLGDLRRRLI